MIHWRHRVFYSISSNRWTQTFLDIKEVFILFVSSFYIGSIEMHNDMKDGY